jgi:hypothetical protein
MGVGVGVGVGLAVCKAVGFAVGALVAGADAVGDRDGVEVLSSPPPQASITRPAVPTARSPSTALLDNLRGRSVLIYLHYNGSRGLIQTSFKHSTVYTTVKRPQ